MASREKRPRETAADTQEAPTAPATVPAHQVFAPAPEAPVEPVSTKGKHVAGNSNKAVVGGVNKTFTSRFKRKLKAEKPK